MRLGEENYEAKEEARSQYTSTGVMKNIELLLLTVISANQLSIYGRVADLCNEVPEDLGAPVKLAALDHWRKMETPTDLFIAENSTNARQWWNLVQEYKRQFEQLRNYPNCVLMRV